MKQQPAPLLSLGTGDWDTALVRHPLPCLLFSPNTGNMQTFLDSKGSSLNPSRKTAGVHQPNFRLKHIKALVQQAVQKQLRAVDFYSHFQRTWISLTLSDYLQSICKDYLGRMGTISFAWRKKKTQEHQILTLEVIWAVFYLASSYQTIWTRSCLPQNIVCYITTH